MWKLRPPKKGETGYLMPVVLANKQRDMWLAERMASDTVFKVGDKVRLAVESSTVGYLYVFDRESYADGSFGEPYMIFPESPRDDNSVRPGVLIDIPDQRDDVPYFNINPREANYTGEMLTVLISPEPLKNIVTDAKGRMTNSEMLSLIEGEMDVAIFSRTDAENKIYSKAESESACGPKTRQLERDIIGGKPCGTQTRQLTRDEPLPQSIYQVKGFVGEPAAVFVKLSVQQ
jgi:hypothetical protein